MSDLDLERLAMFNARCFRTDLAIRVGALNAQPRLRRTPKLDEGDDLFGFRLYANRQSCDIRMPGLALGLVRPSPTNNAVMPRRMVGVSPGTFYFWTGAIDQAARWLDYPDPAVSHD